VKWTSTILQREHFLDKNNTSSFLLRDKIHDTAINSPDKIQLLAHLSLDNVRLAHVPDAQQQVELTVARTDDRSLAEHERLGALLGPRQLGEHQPGHQSLRDDAETRLEHYQRNGVRTVGVHAAIAVADRLLCLDRE